MSEYRSQAPTTLDGWYMLHDLRTLKWDAWRILDQATQAAIVDEFRTQMREWETVDEARKGSFGLFSVAGHKADLMMLQLRPTVKELVDVKTQFARTRLADYMTASYSYLSVVELGSYMARPGVDVDSDPTLQSRLKPQLVDGPYACFYPMSKKRQGQDNWYTLSPEERREFLKNHGLIGREYAGKIKQIISGSMGFDDWEWGVTLFAQDPLQFKKIVSEMRFEEGSARFGDFGPFYVGHRMSAQDLQDYLLGR